MTRSALRLPVLAICGLLTACLGIEDAGDGTQSAGPATAPRASSASSKTGSLALNTPDAAPINDDPMQFLGLVGDDVASRLGAPDLVRRDGSAEVRQFRGGACTLDLFLYPANGAPTVKHVELRGPSLESEARRACLADLIRSRRLSS